MDKKRKAKCRVCKEELHELLFLGEPWGMRQCLNQSCKKYGVAIYG